MDYRDFDQGDCFNYNFWEREFCGCKRFDACDDKKDDNYDDHRGKREERKPDNKCGCYFSIWCNNCPCRIENKHDCEEKKSHCEDKKPCFEEKKQECNCCCRRWFTNCFRCR